jgi:RNA polymerase sigma-70 factor (ECF subfamily)
MEPQSSLRKLIPAADGDEMLVAAAKGGDRSAFDKLVDRHKQKILLLAMRIMRNREDAEEVAQDAFIQAFVHLEKFNGDSRRG